MSTRTNEFGQPIGPAVPGWTTRARPARTPIEGRYCRVEPLDAERHAVGLESADRLDPEARNWTYLGRETLRGVEAYRAWATQAAKSEDPLFYAFADTASEQAVGVGAYLRIDPPNGAIEVGHLLFSPRMQGTRIATEGMYLMMRRVFDELRYRRYEWKCDALNAPSRRAAERLGFTFEGVFRQAVVVKGRNRDSAWFSILDSEWPRLKAGFERWLDPANFDADGRQRVRLEEFRAT
jgi:RimJ/RimL family protein N-acetyltransferase